MGWQDELREQLGERAAAGDYNDAFPFRWSSHICRTTAAVADALLGRIRHTNLTEVAGVRPGAMILLGMSLDAGDGPHLHIGVRKDVAWDLGEPITSTGDHAAGRTTIAFTVLMDAAGGPLYPPFDFAAVVESWRDLPRLF